MKIIYNVTAIRLYTFILAFFLSTIAISQILEPAKWNLGTSADEVAVGQELDLIFNAVIDQNWYLYSSDFDPDLGPMVTEFTFEPSDSYELVGGIRPINPQKKYDDLWEGEYT